MHILLIHQAFVAVNEAGGTRHHEIALHLVAKGHRVTILTSPISYLTGIETVPGAPGVAREGITIIRPPVYSALHRSFVHRVLNFLSFMLSSFWVGMQVADVDLVWGTSPPIFQGLTAWLLARLKKVPFFFEVRDLWPAFAIAVGVLSNKVLIWASEKVERFLYHSADFLVVNSPGFVDHVSSRGGKQVRVVPNGVDVAMFDPGSDGAQFRQEHQLEGKFIALYAGAHGMSNDLGVLLESANLLRDLRDLVVVLVGDGKEKLNLQQRAREMSLPNVRFISPVPKERMVEVVAAADVCIAILKPVELYKTVYPNKVFDYMAGGRPIILAIDGVIRDVVEQAQAGIAVPPGDAQSLADAIRSYTDNREMGRNQGQHGRRFVTQHFDRGVLAEQMLEIMSQVVSPGG